MYLLMTLVGAALFLYSTVSTIHNSAAGAIDSKALKILARIVSIPLLLTGIIMLIGNSL